MTSDFQNEIFIRNIIFVAAAIIGIVFLIGFYFRNLKQWIFFHSKKRIPSEKFSNKNISDEILENEHWESMNIGKNYHVSLDQSCTLWDVSAFKIKMDRIEKLFSNSKDLPWYEFSSSHQDCEKIMLPILKKIRSKYRGKFDQVNPIHVSRIEKENAPRLYTWLKNETHIQTVVFTFLDEILNIAKEANVYPSLSLLWSDVILLEVFLPFHHLFQNMEEDIRRIFGIDFEKEENKIHLKLWIAFSLDKIPPSLMDKSDSDTENISVWHEGLKKAS